jgi:UDP-glucose 4-epimerase
MLTHWRDACARPSRVVILGSAGFVAAATRRRLEAEGVPVLALPRTDLDLTDADAGERLGALLRPSDAVLFVAARAPVKNDAMLIDNLRMGAAVCEALRAVSVDHVVYISSDAVYADSDAPLTEQSSAQPASLHGVMHLAREVMLANAWTGPLCILRPTLIYGVGDPHNGYGPNRFVRLAAAGQDITLFGNGEERRDHVWVEDVAELTQRVMMRRSSGVLNIAVGEVASFRDIAAQITQMFASASTVRGTPRAGPMPHNGYRAFHPAAVQAAFPDFQFASLPDGLRALYAAALTPEF